MPQFHVDEEVARLVERLANPKPFENLSFNAALKRVLDQLLAENGPANARPYLLAEAMARAANAPKKAASPDPGAWAESVPELRRKKFATWKAICNYLQIETAGDSARRKLQNWVKQNKPAWPEVPEIPAE